MTIVLRLSLVCLTLLGLASLLFSCSRKDPIRLGFVGGITGRVADLGVAGRNGTMLAVEERNASGGVNGHLVELLVRDDEQDPATARRVVAELINSNVDAIIGPMTSSMAMATIPLVNSSKTIMVSPTVTTTELTAKDDNFFRVSSNTSEYAAKTARCQFKRFGQRTVAAIYDMGNSSYSESWLNEYRATFTALGGRIVKSATFRSGNDAVFSRMVQDLVAVKPDAILLITNAVDAALICQQIRKLDRDIPIVMAEWASTERFIELAGAASEGVQVSQFLDRNDTSERYRSFLRSYRSRFGQEPGFAGVAAYDAAQVTLEGYARRQPGKSLKETILTTRVFQGVQQAITLDRFGDADRKTFVSIIRNGQYLPLE
jgi:branched-chain amino acid transport system substrate-binding protein